MSNKRLLLILISLAGIVIILTGFIGKTNSQSVINLKFANFFPPPAAQSKICEEFIKNSS